MQFIPNVGQSWKFNSMRLLAIAGALEVAWKTMPPEVLALIPYTVQGYITLGLILLAMFARVVDQGLTPTAIAPEKSDVEA